MTLKSRKYHMVVHNVPKGSTPKRLVKTLVGKYPNTIYCCGKTGLTTSGKEHIHIFIVTKNPISWNELKTFMDSMGGNTYIGERFDNSLEFVTYILAQVSPHPDFFEVGTPPIEKPGKRTDWEKVHAMVSDGCSTGAIMKSMPHLSKNANAISRAQHEHWRDDNSLKTRKVEVIYIHTEHERKFFEYLCATYDNFIFRVCKYGTEREFDNYNYEGVVCFYRFRYETDIYQMIDYLSDGRCYLAARGRDCVAVYNTVFIISYYELGEMYESEQMDDKKAFREFLECIDYIVDEDDTHGHNEYASVNDWNAGKPVAPKAHRFNRSAF